MFPFVKLGMVLPHKVHNKKKAAASRITPCCSKSINEKSLALTTDLYVPFVFAYLGTAEKHRQRKFLKMVRDV